MKFGLLQFAQAASGFTQVLPTGTATSGTANGAGSGNDSTNTNIIYVSYSTGTDTITGTSGTIGNPLKTKSKALTYLRDGFADQMLCKCGDVWPASDVILVALNGAGPGTNGQACTGPMLFGFYGSGNRPVMDVDETAPEGGGFVLDLRTHPCNNLAIIGWEFYAPTRDPTASTYTLAGLASNLSAVTTYGESTGVVGPSWFLVEDCRASWFANTFNMQGVNNTLTASASVGSGNVLQFSSVPSWVVNGMNVFDAAQIGSLQIPYGTTVTGTSSTTVTLSQNVVGYGVANGDPILFVGLAGTVSIRRCLEYCSYAPGGEYNINDGHAQGIYFSCINAPIMDECAIAYSGWNPVLCQPQTVGASGNTLTWPVGSAGGYGFNFLPFPNGAAIYVETTGGGLSSTATYYVINANSALGTFELSATVGGAAVTLSASSYTMMWVDCTLNIYNHTLYCDQFCTTNNATITNNLCLYSSNVMVRPSGTITGNYVAYHYQGAILAGVQNAESGPGYVAPIATYLDLSGNVIQHPGQVIVGGGAAPNWPPLSDLVSGTGNGTGIDMENLNGSGGTVNVTNNIFSMSTPTSPNGTGIVNFCADTGHPSSPANIVENANVTGNIAYNWNDSIGFFENNSNSGAGNTTSPNTVDGVTTYPATNTESYPNPTVDLTTFAVQQWGDDSTVETYMENVIGTVPGEGRALQIWASPYTPQSVVGYVKEMGFAVNN